jgi:zinc protease
MKFLIRFGLLVTLALPFTSTLAQQQSTWRPADTIPNDTNVILGTLPNGMRYYIRYNKKPEQRAELRLVVKAGSLMEDEKQRGLAHWTEHMAFNGTKHFKKNELIEYLQSIGVRFGADLNAYTSFNETVYILPIPTDTLEQVKQGLQILEDWAHGIEFAPDEFEAERGVVISEWRSRLGVGSRISDKLIPALYKGSRYPERFPIGTRESLEGAKREDILRFYKDWYRPDLMAVIAVGDFDVRQMEKMIQDQFSKIPAPNGPTPQPSYPIPPQPGTTVLVAKDPELTGTQVQLIYKRSAYAKNTVAAQRDGLRRALFTALFNQRITEILQEPDAPFVSAGAGFGGLEGGGGTAEISAIVADNETQRGFEALLTEMARVVQHGFTQSELDRAKKSYLARVEHLYQNRNDRNSGELVNAYVAHFLQGNAFPSIDTSFQGLRSTKLIKRRLSWSKKTIEC